MTVLSAHLRSHSYIVDWLEDAYPIDTLLSALNRSELANSPLLPPVSSGRYPWARVGTAFSVGASLSQLHAVPQSVKQGALAFNELRQLGQVDVSATGDKLTKEALLLEPFETGFRSAHLYSPMFDMVNIGSQVTTDLNRLFEHNIPLLNGLRGSGCASDESYSYKTNLDSITADPDLVFRSSNTLTIVETKTTTKPTSAQLGTLAIEQLLFLALFAIEPRNPVHVELYLHLSRQAKLIRIPIPSETIYALRANLDLHSF